MCGFPTNAAASTRREGTGARGERGRVLVGEQPNGERVVLETAQGATRAKRRCDELAACLEGYVRIHVESDRWSTPKPGFFSSTWRTGPKRPGARPRD